METLCELRNGLTPEVRAGLEKNLLAYPDSYDEVFSQVGGDLQTNGYIRKIDISALAAWKRLNLSTEWMSSLQKIADADLINRSRVLLSEGLDLRERITLFWKSGIPGFSNGTFAVASTVLSAWNPEIFGITDRRSRARLLELGCSCGSRINTYSRYLDHLHFIQDEMNSERTGVGYSCRDIDVMLFSRTTK